MTTHPFMLTVTLQQRPDGRWNAYILADQDSEILAEGKRTHHEAAAESEQWFAKMFGHAHPIHFEFAPRCWTD